MSHKDHLTVPPGFRPRDPAVVLHRADLADIDIIQRTGYRITSPVRSIIDIAATGVDAAQLNRAINEAQTRGLLTLASRPCAHRNRTPRHQPPASLPHLLAHRHRALDHSTASG